MTVASWKPTRLTASYIKKPSPWTSRARPVLPTLNRAALSTGDLSYSLLPQEADPEPMHLNYRRRTAASQKEEHVKFKLKMHRCAIEVVSSPRQKVCESRLDGNKDAVNTLQEV